VDRSLLDTNDAEERCVGVSLHWQLVRRVAFAVFAAYLILSLTFAFVVLTADPQISSLKRAAALEAEDEEIPLKETDAWDRLEEYKERRGLDEPLLERYRNWIVSYATLDWGQSHGASGKAAAYGQGYPANTPVTTLVVEALFHTLRYVLPAMVFAVGSGLAVGLYTATHQHTFFDRLATSAAHLGFSLPNFWIGTILLLVLLGQSGWLTGLTGSSYTLLKSVILPAFVLTTSLLAGQLRYARAESLEYINAEFIKLVRAKGAREWRVARHLLRNAAIPLFSLFFTDMIGILVLNIYVIEYVFGIPGLGGLSLVAIQSRDLPVVLGTTMVIVLFGIVGNLLQDVGYFVLDPRLGE
jgi:peptide/nickel transport system permease protein